MNDIAIILVAPQMGENIGAVARVMKNFSLNNLRIVSPRDGWPNEAADAMSVGAIDLINSAEIYQDLPAAISDLSYIYAATATPRNINKNYVLSRNLTTDIPSSSKIGIMFGRENSGLTNEEISYANKILTIDTNVNFSSMNIAHAVSVICYELFQAKLQMREDLGNYQDIATNKAKDYFYQQLLLKLESNNFFKDKAKKDLSSQKIRNIFGRIENLSQSELQLLHGMINSLAKK